MHNLGGGGRDERKLRYVMPEPGLEVGVWWGMREGGCHIEGVEEKNKQNWKQTETKSREIIGSEIMRNNAMSQSLHFSPRLLRMSKMIRFSFWRDHSGLAEKRMAWDEKGCIYIIVIQIREQIGIKLLWISSLILIYILAKKSYRMCLQLILYSCRIEAPISCKNIKAHYYYFWLGTESPEWASWLFK